MKALFLIFNLPVNRLIAMAHEEIITEFEVVASKKTIIGRKWARMCTRQNIVMRQVDIFNY